MYSKHEDIFDLDPTYWAQRAAYLNEDNSSHHRYKPSLIVRKQKFNPKLWI